MLHIYAMSDKGQVRQENEDCFLAAGLIDKRFMEMGISENGLFFNGYGLLCAVADGMGGHAGGSLASRLALESLALESYCLQASLEPQEIASHLSDTLKRTHKMINERGNREAGFKGMGTTIVGLFLSGRQCISFHVGDSRLYRFRGEGLVQLTTDHSMENANILNAPGQEIQGKSGAIYNTLGGGSDLECYPEINEVGVAAGDVLMLCSDGLSDMLDINSIERALRERSSLQNAAVGLISMANQAGGLDNITVMLIERIPE